MWCPQIESNKSLNRTFGWEQGRRTPCAVSLAARCFTVQPAFWRPEPWRGHTSPTRRRRPRRYGGRKALSRKRMWRSKRSSRITRRRAATRSTSTSRRSRHSARRSSRRCKAASFPTCFRPIRPRSLRSMPGTTSWSTSAMSSRRRRKNTPRPRCSIPIATTASPKNAAFMACPIRPHVCRTTSGSRWSRRPASKWKIFPRPGTPSTASSRMCRRTCARRECAIHMASVST